MPDTTWAVSRYPPGFSRGRGAASVSMSPFPAFDTSSVVRFRSPSQLIPDTLTARLFRNAQHPGSLPTHLAVVWHAGWPGGISPPGSRRSGRELSTHPARATQPAATPPGSGVSRWVLPHQRLPTGAPEWPNPFTPTPLQGLHRYYGPVRPCAPQPVLSLSRFCRLRFSLSLASGVRASLVTTGSLFRDDRFSRSARKPELSSRHLNAGHHLGSK